jgi:hypothetical protein
MQTATGYGKKLNSGKKVRFNGRTYRIYIYCFSNVGTAYIISKGKPLVLRGI